jgi:molybdate transport system regulatory protein
METVETLGKRRKRRRPASRPHFDPKKRDREPPDACAGDAAGYVLKGRFWINKGDAGFLAHGRITLLERIKASGSISGAARSMEMSYRHAWELVESMNRAAPRPLVETATGGKGGGGARLTPEGEKMIRLFWKIQAELSAFFRKKQEWLDSLK